jgi:hypothetical protein
MKRKYEIKKIHKQTLVGGMIAIALCSHFLLFGCTGATIREDRRIPLVANQPYEGVSKTGHYILEYSFTFHPKASDETGSMEFTGNLKPTRPLENLSIRLQFLDSEGKVIDMEPIYGSGHMGGASKATIQKRFETPPGTVAIAFSHYASVRTIKP